MKSNTELLAVARAQIGNTGGKYRNYVHASGSWCDMFVFWLYDANGCGSLLTWKGQQRTYCPASIKWCNANLALVPMYLAQPCDIIYYDWDKNGVPNHIGIVESKVSTSTINAIEGNTNGGKVARKSRPVKYVCGIYRPQFAVPFKDKKLDIDGDFGFQSIGVTQKALKTLGYYTGQIDTVLGKGTVRAIQKLCGAKQDGAWGADTSGKLQQYLKNKGYYTGQIDKAFGKQSVIALQKWANANAYPQSKPVTTVKVAYGGAYPDLVVHSGQKIAYTARDLAYAKGTKKATYTYPEGKAKAAFTAAINKVYPKRSRWSKQCQKGASCDVGAGTIIRYSGVDTKVPRGLSEQLDHFKKSSLWKKTGLTKCSQAGDVAMQPSPSAHIWIGLGDGNIAEANHTWKFYEHIVKDTRKINGKAKSGVYRCTKATPISKNDRGTEVTKLQNFLNWAGFNCGKADGDFGMGTLAAVKAFQAKVGITQDGIVGSGTINKMKAYIK